jgi:hypothetical protein
MPQPHESDSMLHHIREVAEADEAREIRGSRSIGNTGRHCPGRRFATTGSSLMAGPRSRGQPVARRSTLLGRRSRLGTTTRASSPTPPSCWLYLARISER